MAYSYFEDIVCINLDISVDRRQHAEYYFKELGIPARFFTANKHPEGGMYGCFHSHIEVLKDAYNRGLNNILVFEDDFLPTAAYSEQKLQKAIDFMKSNDDWDIMHLGYGFLREDMHGLSTIFDAEYVSDDIVRYNPVLTQALCYSRKAMEKIIENYEDYIGIIQYDVYLSYYLNLTNYCIIPMLFDQNFYFSYNNEPADCFEYIIRMLYPFLAFSKINYRMTELNYIFTKYRYKSMVLFTLFLCIIISKKNIFIK